MQGDKSTRDRRSPCATISLDDIAIDFDLTLAQGLKVNHRPQGARDQALNFLRAPRLLALGGFAPSLVEELVPLGAQVVVDHLRLEGILS